MTKVMSVCKFNVKIITAADKEHYVGVHHWKQVSCCNKIDTDAWLINVSTYRWPLADNQLRLKTLHHFCTFTSSFTFMINIRMFVQKWENDGLVL